MLFDRGYVSTPEPFKKLVNQGMILGENGEKMSKSRGNVVNPDQVISEYGADSLRLYEMFMGPLEATKPWSTAGVNGVFGFLGRAWRMIISDHSEQMRAQSGREQSAADGRTKSHAAQNDCRGDQGPGPSGFQHGHRPDDGIHEFFHQGNCAAQEAMEKFVLLLAPFAPHIAEELWQALGHSKTLAYEPWPQVDRALASRKTRSKFPCKSMASCAAKSRFCLHRQRIKRRSKLRPAPT